MEPPFKLLIEFSAHLLINTGCICYFPSVMSIMFAGTKVIPSAMDKLAYLSMDKLTLVNQNKNDFIQRSLLSIFSFI